MQLIQFFRAAVVAVVLAGLWWVPLAAAAAAASGHSDANARSQSHTFTLQDIAFMTGHWRGEVPGGELEEVFTEPRNGTMVGLFRWMADGSTTLTEHITIEQNETGVRMFLRHFNPGNVPWESERDGPLTLALTEAANGHAVFSNPEYTFPKKIIYRQPAPDEMTATLQGETSDGGPRQLQLTYHRSNSMTTSTETVNKAASALGYTGGLTIAFNVADLAKSKQWYQEVLGFNMLYEVEEIGWCELSCPTNGVQIGLSQVETPKTGGPTPTFAVEDIDAARNALESRNVRFDGPTIELPGMVKLATFFDPDGNSFMLSQSLMEGIQ